MPRRPQREIFTESPGRRPCDIAAEAVRRLKSCPPPGTRAIPKKKMKENRHSLSTQVTAPPDSQKVVELDREVVHQVSLEKDTELDNEANLPRSMHELNGKCAVRTEVVGRTSCEAPRLPKKKATKKEKKDVKLMAQVELPCDSAQAEKHGNENASLPYDLLKVPELNQEVVHQASLQKVVELENESDLPRGMHGRRGKCATRTESVGQIPCEVPQLSKKKAPKKAKREVNHSLMVAEPCDSAQCEKRGNENVLCDLQTDVEHDHETTLPLLEETFKKQSMAKAETSVASESHESIAQNAFRQGIVTHESQARFDAHSERKPELVAKQQEQLEREREIECLGIIFAAQGADEAMKEQSFTDLVQLGLRNRERKRHLEQTSVSGSEAKSKRCRFGQSFWFHQGYAGDSRTVKN